MKRFSEQLKKKSQSVKLRASERADLRERLVAYMEYHPLPKTTAQKNAEAYIRSEEFSILRFNTAAVRGFVSAFAVLILIMVPVVAERAVPGDVLYPVKVNFNEELRSSLSVSPYAKVEWETKRLERRIAEARLLASEGKLTDDVEAEVAEAVKAHSDAAQEGIAAIRESDRDEAAMAEITFESALAVQSEVLEGTLKKEMEASGGASSTEGHTVAGLAGAVEEARKDASERQSGTLPSYEKFIARMETETTRAYELFESVKGIASEEEITDIERRLSDIERKMNDAAGIRSGEIEVEIETEVATGTPSVVPEVALLRTALSDTRKLISFMTDIDVRENVTIEELVPVTLTPEERLAAARARQTALDTTLGRLGETLEERPIDEITEKVEFGFVDAVEHASSSRAAIASGDFETAEFNLDEAEVMTEDLVQMLGGIEVKEPNPEQATTTQATTATTTSSSTEVAAPTETETSTTSTSTEAGAATSSAETGEAE